MKCLSPYKNEATLMSLLFSALGWEQTVERAALSVNVVVDS